MKSYKLSLLAQQDLADILNFIAQDNVEMAYRWHDKLKEAMTTLASNPLIGTIRPDLTNKAVRFWPVGNYFIVYRANNGLEIVRVLSSYRNLISLLN